MSSHLNGMVPQQGHDLNMPQHSLLSSLSPHPLLPLLSIPPPPPPPLPSHMPQHTTHPLSSIPPPPPPPPISIHSSSSHSYNTIHTTIPTLPVPQPEVHNQQNIVIGDDKKKEAQKFLRFYFTINPHLSLSTLRRTTILALYTHKLSLDARYKKPNDMANLCGVIYGHIHAALSEESRRDFVKMVEAERQTTKKDTKKRRRKSKNQMHEDQLGQSSSSSSSSSSQQQGQDTFISCLKSTQFIPFLELIPSESLDPCHEWAMVHPDWAYTLDDLARWESDMKEIQVHTKQLAEDSSAYHFSRVDQQPRMKVDVPINLFETPDSFIIYAFVPFHKPNAMKVTVNQMDVVLEGVVSLPQTCTIASTGEDVNLPEGLMCTKMEILEGSFCKVIKLTSPVASSVVGKRDGVIVIHAHKEESQPTIHKL